MKRTIAALAFSAVIALSLAANTTQSYAAKATAVHGAQVDKAGSSQSGTLSPYDALGISWE